MIPLDDRLRPKWLFEQTVHEGCDRAGYYEQGQFTHQYGTPECLVRIGCWGRIYVVGCEPSAEGIDPDGFGAMGLSEPMQAALEPAAEIVAVLAGRIRAEWGAFNSAKLEGA
jgi:hypothetical protein